MMSARRSRQQGLGILSVTVTVLLVSFFLTLAFKLGPLYLNDWTLRSILDKVAADPEAAAGGRRAILGKVESYMNINSLDYPTTREFELKQTSDRVWTVIVDYERREHLFFNVDAVVSFQHQVEVQPQ